MTYFQRTLLIGFGLSLLLLPLLGLGIDISTKKQPWMALQSSKGSISITSLAADKQGNAYVTSSYSAHKTATLYGRHQNVQAKPGPETKYASHSMLCKYNSEGSIDWSLPITSATSAHVWKSHLGKDGNLYIGGNFKTNATFFSTTGDSVFLKFQLPPGYGKVFYRFFLAKYTPQGKLLWVRTGHSWDNMVCFDIATDANGNAYAWLYSPSNHITLGDFSLAPNANKTYVERYYGIFVKFNADGNEEWITCTGDNCSPRQMWINEDEQLCVAALVTEYRFAIKYSDGTEQVIHEPDKATYRDELFVFETSQGKLLSRDLMFPQVSEGHLVKVTEVADGYLATYYSKSIYGKGYVFTIDEKSIRTQKRDPDYFLVKFSKERKLLWYVQYKGELREAFADVLQLANGDVLYALMAPGNMDFTEAGAMKATHFPSTNQKNVFLFHLNPQGKLIDRYLVAGETYANHQCQVHMASPDGKQLYLSSSYSRPFTLYGQALETEQAPKSNRFDSHPNAVLALLPDAKSVKSLELIQDSLKPTVQIKNFYNDSRKRFLATVTMPDTLRLAVKEADTTRHHADALLRRSQQVNTVFLFPNPVSSERPSFTLRLESPETGKVSLTLFAPTGQTLLQEDRKLNQGTNNLAITLPQPILAGTYLLHIRQKQYSLVRKILVN